MSLSVLSDKVRLIFDLRRYLKEVLPTVGSTQYSSSVYANISAKLVSVFGASGIELSGFRDEANAFASSYSDFLLDDTVLDIFASQPFINGTGRFLNAMQFISTYFRTTTPSQVPDFDRIVGAIRYMAAEPEECSFTNMLEQLTLPAQRMPAALNSFIISPNQICNIKTPTMNLSADMQMRRPNPNSAQQMVDSHVELGKNAVYLVFRNSDAADQTAQLDLTCNLNSVGNIGNLHAAAVTIEFVNSIEGKLIPRACVPGRTRELRPILRLPVIGEDNAVHYPGEGEIKQFRMAGGQATLQIPYAVALEDVLAHSYVIIKISGLFLTTGCGLNEMFAERNYSPQSNIPGFPDLVNARTIFRTSNGCINDSPSGSLDAAFKAIFARAVDNYRQGPLADGVAPIVYDVSMFNYPNVMRVLLDSPSAEAEQRLPLQRRLLLLRHMYIVSLVLYGLAGFSI